jgi:hypothetical protein
MAKKLIQILISFFVFGFCLLLATLADSENISDSFSLKAFDCLHFSYSMDRFYSMLHFEN